MKRSYVSFMIIGILGVGMGLAVRTVLAGTPTPTRPGAAARGPRTNATAEREPAELAEMRQELIQLRHQVRAHEQRLASPAPGEDAPSHRPEPDPQGPDARAERERRRQDYVAAIDA